MNGNKVIKDNFSKKVDKNLKFSDESEAYNQFRSNAHFTPHPGLFICNIYISLFIILLLAYNQFRSNAHFTPHPGKSKKIIFDMCFTLIFEASFIPSSK